MWSCICKIGPMAQDGPVTTSSMTASNPGYRRVAAGAVLLAAAVAGCGGGGDSQPPLPLDERNATSVAAEALITTGQTSFTVRLPPGFTPDGAGSPADGTTTAACAASGSQTTVTAGTTATITFNDCVEDATTRITGSLKLAIQPSGATDTPDQISLAATSSLSVTVGALTFTESGGYTMVIRTALNPTDETATQLIGDRLVVGLRVGGSLRDQVTMSNFEIDVSEQLTTTDQQIEHFSYDLDSTRLAGHVTVMTTQDLKRSINVFMPRQFPFAGQILIGGANHTRLQIAILGDEVSTPPAGGQIELRVDTGSGAFGAPIYTSWSALSAMISAP